MKMKMVGFALFAVFLMSSCKFGTNKDVDSMEDPLKEVGDQQKEAMEKAIERANPMGEQDSAVKQDSVPKDSAQIDSVR